MPAPSHPTEIESSSQPRRTSGGQDRTLDSNGNRIVTVTEQLPKASRPPILDPERERPSGAHPNNRKTSDPPESDQSYRTQKILFLSKVPIEPTPTNHIF